jgi:hypothetical protein
VTLHVTLQDPSKPKSDTNKTVVKGQTILMFNRIWEPESHKDIIRDLRLDLHWKYVNVTKISKMKRFKRRDDKGKFIETTHQRLEDLEFTHNTKKHDEFRERTMYNESHTKQDLFEDGNDLKNSFESRPSVLNFYQNHADRFKYEKKKGSLSIDKVMFLEWGQQFPGYTDIVIDFEIDDVLGYGLSYIKTNEPSGKGCYLATTHRYFETQYWLPCIDSLKQKNKWKITIVVDKENEVACSGVLEKMIEIDGTENMGYLYRVDNPISAWKIGFFIGSKFQETENWYFSNAKRMEDYTKYFINEHKVVFDIIETYEQVLNHDFPYENINLVFVPNMFTNDDSKRRALWYSGLCFIDEKLILTESIIDKREEAYFHIAYALATNYFGWYIQEDSFTDFWLVEGIAQSLANLYTRLKWGMLLYKYNTMQKIRYIKNETLKGLEIYPLSSENLPHPSYVQYNNFYFVKSWIVMHILESRIQKDHYHKLLKILVKDWTKKRISLSTKDFKKKFKKLWGFTPKMLHNWLYYTGTVDINVKSEFCKKNNTLTLVINQRNVLTHDLARQKMISEKREEHALSAHNLYSSDYFKYFGKFYIVIDNRWGSVQWRIPSWKSKGQYEMVPWSVIYIYVWNWWIYYSAITA